MRRLMLLVCLLGALIVRAEEGRDPFRNLPNDLRDLMIRSLDLQLEQTADSLSSNASQAVTIYRELGVDEKKIRENVSHGLKRFLVFGEIIGAEKNGLGRTFLTLPELPEGQVELLSEKYAGFGRRLANNSLQDLRDRLPDLILAWGMAAQIGDRQLMERALTQVLAGQQWSNTIFGATLFQNDAVLLNIALLQMAEFQISLGYLPMSYVDTALGSVSQQNKALAGKLARGFAEYLVRPDVILAASQAARTTVKATATSHYGFALHLLTISGKRIRYEGEDDLRYFAEPAVEDKKRISALAMELVSTKFDLPTYFQLKQIRSALVAAGDLATLNRIADAFLANGLERKVAGAFVTLPKVAGPEVEPGLQPNSKSKFYRYAQQWDYVNDQRAILNIPKADRQNQIGVARAQVGAFHFLDAFTTYGECGESEKAGELARLLISEGTYIQLESLYKYLMPYDR